jgi:hypothetical protein
VPIGLQDNRPADGAHQSSNQGTHANSNMLESFAVIFGFSGQSLVFSGKDEKRLTFFKFLLL